MRNASAILIIAALVIGETHSWFDRYDMPNVNWIIDRPTPMWLTWNIKYAEGQLQWILIAVAGMIHRNTRFNKAAWIMLICFTILDTLFYFYNYKTHGYAAVYPLCVVAFLTAYFLNRK